MSPEFFWIAVVAVTVTSAARLTRLVTFDAFPPVAWIRGKLLDWLSPKWALVAYCGYCASFWLTLLVVLTGYFSDWHTVWWIVNGTLGASYLAAILMVHDGDDSDYETALKGDA